MDDSMLVLANLLTRHERIDSPRKLQTAVYLAQEATGKRVYYYRLIQGKVLSDDLDQDVAGLEAAGMLVPNSDREPSNWEIVVHAEAAPTRRVINDYKDLFDIASRLLQSDSEVLEGAASMCRFQSGGSDSSVEELSWFRRLDTLKKESATRLCDDVAHSFVGAT